MNAAKRTSLIRRIYQASIVQGIKKVLTFNGIEGKRLRRIGRFLSTPRTHSNINRNRQRRRDSLQRRLSNLRQRQHDRLVGA